MSDDVLTNKERIEEKIFELEQERGKLEQAAQERALAISHYDRAIALVLLRMKNGLIQKFEGEEVGNVSVTNQEKIAKGICWRERLRLEEAESMYKSLVSNIDSIKAELNGLQSINRHLQWENLIHYDMEEVKSYVNKDPSHKKV